MKQKLRQWFIKYRKSRVQSRRLKQRHIFKSPLVSLHSNIVLLVAIKHALLIYIKIVLMQLNPESDVKMYKKYSELHFNNLHISTNILYLLTPILFSNIDIFQSTEYTIKSIKKIHLLYCRACSYRGGKVLVSNKTFYIYFQYIIFIQKKIRKKGKNLIWFMGMMIF